MAVRVRCLGELASPPDWPVAVLSAKSLGIALPRHHVYWSIGKDALASAVYLPKERSLYLSSALVTPALRGRGYQRRLIFARVRYARRLGCRSVITYTIPDNPASMNSLIRAGFKVYTPEWAWAGRAQVYWRRDL